MVSLSFYGGIGEIGGNKILLEDEDSRMWFDFGEAFDMGEEFFVNWLSPRRHNGVGDYFEFDLLPKIPGLYSEETLFNTSLSYTEPQFDAVFLSHAHYDHVNHIGFLDPGIPIYTGEGTKIFIDAFERTSYRADYGKHDYRCFRTGDIVRVNDVEVEPIHVDHSIPAAYGYIIHTSEGAVVYTGDLRAHGPRADMTEEFLEAAEYYDPVAMISEGTRMLRRGRRRHLSESGVYRGVKKVIEEADREGKAVIYTHPSRDMDRLRTFHTAAESSGRVMVIDIKKAYLLDRLIEDEHLPLADPLSDDLIRVYYRKKKSCTYNEMDYYIWERKYLDRMITSQELREHPERYIVNLDFYNLAELIDIRPEEGSPFIYSRSEPFTEEDIEDEVLHNWLDHFGLVYHQLHASGHMSRKELGEMVNRVKPGKLFPVHTEQPELFKEHYPSTICPDSHKRYEL
ncbi:MAG: MBL fold metallo-hydrolase [Candidatus Bathyarchaeia archaeon]